MFVPAYGEQELREVVARSTSLSEVLRHFGLRTAGGNHRQLRRWLERWNISTDHFDYRSNLHRGKRTPLEQILVEHSTFSRGHLKQRLYDEGLKQRRCELCGLGEEWRGRRMSLILDHINGVGNDNRIENLRIVCPNCAATLDTHCGRQNRRYPDRTCPHCLEPFAPRTAVQRFCSRRCSVNAYRPQRAMAQRRVQRPPYEQLVAEVAAGWSAVGRKYGVSDNAVRKWVRAYEREQRAAGVGEPAMERERAA